MPKIECACLECGKTFFKFPSAITNGRGRFCSRHCMGIVNGRREANALSVRDRRGSKNPNWRGRSAVKPCIICFALFAKPTITCSADCGHRLQAQRISKEGNGNWVSESRWLEGNYRKLVKFRACNRCGSKRRLLVHHQDRNRSNNATANLEVLCYSCHTKEHANDLFLTNGSPSQRFLKKIQTTTSQP